MWMKVGQSTAVSLLGSLRLKEECKVSLLNFVALEGFVIKLRTQSIPPVVDMSRNGL